MTLLINGQSHYRRTVLLDQWHGALESRTRMVAILKVHRVDYRTATDELKSRLHNLWFSRVDNQRQGRRGGETRNNLGDVADTITSDVIDTDIQKMRTIANLLLRNLNAVIPALFQHRLAECFGSVRICALTDC